MVRGERHTPISDGNERDRDIFWEKGAVNSAAVVENDTSGFAFVDGSGVQRSSSTEIE